jgi:uncharacterized membrane protein
VETQLDRAETSYQQRAQSLDGKAGLLLTAAGVIVGFANTSVSVATTIGQGWAVLAAAMAIWAFLPRVGGIIEPGRLEERYLNQPELTTRLVVLGTRIALYRADEEALRRKNHRLRLALFALFIAAVAVLIGTILKVA